MSTKSRISPLVDRADALGQRAIRLHSNSEAAAFNHFLGGIAEAMKWHKFGRQHTLTPARVLEILEDAVNFGERDHQAFLAKAAELEAKGLLSPVSEPRASCLPTAP